MSQVKSDNAWIMVGDIEGLKQQSLAIASHPFSTYAEYAYIVEKSDIDRATDGFRISGNRLPVDPLYGVKGLFART